MFWFSLQIFRLIFANCHLQCFQVGRTKNPVADCVAVPISHVDENRWDWAFEAFGRWYNGVGPYMVGQQIEQRRLSTWQGWWRWRLEALMVSLMKGAKMRQRHFDWYDMPDLSFGVSVCAQVTSPMRPALPSTKSSRRPDRFAESAGWRWKWCNFSDLGSTSTIPVTTGLWYLYILCGFLSISLSLSLAGASQTVVSEVLAW